MLVLDVVAGEVSEDVEDAAGGGGGAGAILGVHGELLEASLAHAVADVAFDEGLDEQGGEVAEQECFDAAGIVQEHGRDVVRAFELGVTLLEVGLVLVRGEDFGAAEAAVVGDQWPAAVAGGVACDGVVVEAPADGEHIALDLAVAGVRAGSPALLLPDGLEGVRLGRGAEVAARAGGLQSRGGGVVRGFLALDAVAG